jgi:hypothetical protein
VGVFPVIYKQWKDRHAVPRTARRCATYLRDALALLDAQWPLRQGETLDPASPATLAAVDGALRFVIYFAERDVPPEREYEFLLAEPMLQLTRILVDGALKQKPPVDLSFDYARDAAGRRMREIRASRPFVLRTVLRAMRNTRHAHPPGDTVGNGGARRERGRRNRPIRMGRLSRNPPTRRPLRRSPRRLARVR